MTTTTKTTSAPAPQPASGATCPDCGTPDAPTVGKDTANPNRTFHKCRECGRRFKTRLIVGQGGQRREFCAG